MESVVVPKNLEIYKGKKVLVTGSTGFKGAWLSYWLKLIGADVCGIALEQEDKHAIFHLLNLEGMIDQHYQDIRDLKGVETIFESLKPDVVFHLAAQALVRYSYDYPKETFDTNVGGSINILEAIRKTDSIKSVVYVTTDKCYKNNEWIWGYRENDQLGGHDPYSASKAAAEIIFSSYVDSFFSKNKNLGISSVRAGNVIGGGDWSADRIVPDCFKSLYEGKSILIRNPNATRPWQHVLDPLFAYLVLGAKQFGSSELSGSWNFGPNSTSNRSVEELVTEILKHWGQGKMEVAKVDGAVHEANLLQLNCDKAKALLNWNPVWNFKKTIFYTTNWYKHYQAKEDIVKVTKDQILSFMGEIND